MTRRRGSGANTGRGRATKALLDTGDLLRDYLPADYPTRLSRRLRQVRDEAQLAEALRAVRRREMVRLVWRDLAGWAGLEETLRDLSRLAEACLDAALDKLAAWTRSELGQPRSARGEAQSLIVLGMGKLGAGELNVSSDIDLIFAYPEEGATRKRGGISNEEYFTRLGQRLVQVIGEPTAGGFVFRVDMRLRPYGDSGPLVLSFDALEEYYQSQGREWERYAMIKARVVAGDRAAGKLLLELLHPFIYRRYLDFGAFESLREMKALIQRQVQRKGLEHNIKLGRGGIREIEFIGQAFQLIRGGREPTLQERGIMKVLPALARMGYLPEFVTRALLDAYVFLRRTENRLQAFADEQVHTIPRDDYGRLRLAFSMGYGSWSEYAAELDRHRDNVHEHFEQVFAAPQADSESERGDAEQALAGVWHGALDVNQSGTALVEAGFDEPVEALRLVERLREGHAFRSAGSRGRERLD
ncbi:MAG: bifunctional [glutamate--ammonia ligase]-adenylyl-L-tyrosine phosphorylase/[glutamate--ammonia-ligase] adenylyltransferase, partial [Pseudolabrys sp.]